ncbi:MAG: hypothetical protein DHS80DRAFT_31012 [Piptocephalis tieghemiana]|nr:MAG: hypothetical protein DHS80DRAFT_31012 [Piptocephalis tieghemiana]
MHVSSFTLVVVSGLVLVSTLPATIMAQSNPIMFSGGEPNTPEPSSPSLTSRSDSPSGFPASSAMFVSRDGSPPPPGFSQVPTQSQQQPIEAHPTIPQQIQPGGQPIQSGNRVLSDGRVVPPGAQVLPDGRIVGSDGRVLENTPGSSINGTTPTVNGTQSVNGTNSTNSTNHTSSAHRALSPDTSLYSSTTVLLVAGTLIGQLLL